MRSLDKQIMTEFEVIISLVEVIFVLLVAHNVRWGQKTLVFAVREAL